MPLGVKAKPTSAALSTPIAIKLREAEVAVEEEVVDLRSRSCDARYGDKGKKKACPR
jgi:hypothetical protein